MADDKSTAQEPTVIKNASQAYGYKYSSLADIANAGVTIPVMRVKPTEFGEYIEYSDENGEWQTGAKIVVPEMKGCNAAQAYGSALTYARRYTVQLAKSLACDDDAAIERQKPEAKQVKPERKVDFKRLTMIRGKLPTINTVAALAAYQKSLNLDQMHWDLVKKDFSKRKEEINGVAG